MIRGECSFELDLDEMIWDGSFCIVARTVGEILSKVLPVHILLV